MTVLWIGETRNENETHNVLRAVDVSIVNQNQCNESYWGIITDQMFCAGYVNGGRDACEGWLNVNIYNIIWSCDNH